MSRVEVFRWSGRISAVACWTHSLVEDRSEVGLADLQRDLENRDARHKVSGPKLAAALRELGWIRDGWMHTGHDRTPRYVRRHKTGDD